MYNNKSPIEPLNHHTTSTGGIHHLRTLPVNINNTVYFVKVILYVSHIFSYINTHESC